jgi:hypothetical protein
MEGEFTGIITVNSQGTDNPPPVVLPGSSFQQDARWRLVLRVAASREFSKSPRLRQFLLYVCEKALTGSIQDMHEQQIGIDVFGRRPGYNPGEDNIVRVAARELRRRLDRYFDSEGADEPIRLQIPKGSYVPVFATSEKLIPLASDQIGSAGSSDPQPGHPTEETARGALFFRITGMRISWAMVSWALLIALLGFGLGLSLEFLHANRMAQQALASGSQGITKADSGTPTSLWLSLFDPQRPVIIVVSDASLVLVQSLDRQLIPLEDYSNGSYLAKLAKLKPELALIASRPYTSLADAVLTAQLAQTAAAQHQTTIVRYARDLKMRDFKDENLLFLGSAYSDPWILQFDQARNFIVGVDETTRRLYFLNKSPQTGEQTRYYAAGENNNSNENYGLITYLPSSGHASKVLILDGTNAVATEAAGDFITDPYYAAYLAQNVSRPVDKSSLPSFQVLLKVATLNNAPSELHVIAHRVSSNSPEGR